MYCTFILCHCLLLCHMAPHSPTHPPTHTHTHTHTYTHTHTHTHTHTSSTGSIPECDGDKLFKTCTVFSPEGEMVAKIKMCQSFHVSPYQYCWSVMSVPLVGHYVTVNLCLPAVYTRYTRYCVINPRA